MNSSIHIRALLCGFLCSITSVLGCRLADSSFQGADTDPVAKGCEAWRKGDQRFETLRNCILSVAHNGTRKGEVVAMLGPGERVTVPHETWAPPKEAYSYTPADRENFHYVVVYRDDVVVELCGYALESDGRPSVILN